MNKGQDKIPVDRSLLEDLMNYLHCWKAEWEFRHGYCHPEHSDNEKAVKELLTSKAYVPVPITESHPAEPDWTNSLTSESSLWKNPLLSLQDRLNIADGTIAFQEMIIDNLWSKLKEKEQNHE